MDQVVSRRSVTSEAWVQSQASPFGIGGGQIFIRTEFSSRNFILAVLRTNTFIYHQRYVISATYSLFSSFRRVVNVEYYLLLGSRHFIFTRRGTTQRKIIFNL
jgi:hypothetical protein